MTAGGSTGVSAVCPGGINAAHLTGAGGCGLNKELVSDLPQEEQEFVANYLRDKKEGLKHYVGKKAIGRLGCYACHDVPGFESFRPIGTGLNDWGKKDASRLALENIDNYAEHHFYPVQT